MFPHVSHPKHISWLTIILALLAVGTFVAIAGENKNYVVPMGMGGVTNYYGASTDVSMPPQVGVMNATGEVTARSVQSAQYDQATPSSMPMRAGVGGGVAPDYYPYYSGTASANDTRELLKVNYNADMRTRDVPGLVRRVETTVRGHGGRVDQESSSPQSGYVSFVVSQSKYDAFRTELETLVWSKFLTVNVQSSNMLPQKQSIEEQQKQADKTLADYQASRSKLVSAHVSTVKSLQVRIDADTQTLATLRAQTPTYDIQTQIQTVSDELASLKQQLANENASYKAQLSNADANIKYAQDWQKAVKTQDQALLDNVATVNGTVSIQWISLWDMTQLYLPGYWIPTIFGILTIFSYLYDRKRFGVGINVRN